jgi:hypothetical protein
LHAFREASGIRSDSKTAGRSSITNSPFCGRLVCACAAAAAQLARTMSAARQVPLIVILILSGSPSEMLTWGDLVARISLNTP